MTGLHMGHTTVRTNPGGASLLAEDVTVAQVLKKAGYVCGGFGKWGIGDVTTPGVPEKHGFDEFFGYYHQVHAHFHYPRYLWRNSKKVLLTGNQRPLVDAREAQAYREDKQFVGKQLAQHVILDEAKKFIRANKEKSFFCYCPWTPPHGTYPKLPTEPAAKEFENKPWSDNAKIYAAMVKMIDNNVGEILSLLKELKIDDNTVVFFCSDNGGLSEFKNEFQSTGKNRGNKGNFYEGGLRVPFFVRWPGKIAPGSKSDILCYFPDVMPTLAQIAGAEKYMPGNLDGISIVPTLLGQANKQKEHEFLYWEYPKVNFQTKKFDPDKSNMAIRRGKWKLVRHGKAGTLELFDLGADISETNDLARKHPEIVAQLKALADAAHSPVPPQIEADVPLGRKYM
jgi:arylsulfatase A-like enzyme